MRKTFYFLAFLMLLPMSWGQVSNPSIIVVASAPSGACNVNLPDRQVTAAGTVYTCQSGTWAELSGSGGGASFTPTGLQYATSTTAATVATSAQIAATLNSSPTTPLNPLVLKQGTTLDGMVSFGDSITAGTGASTQADAYAFLMSTDINTLNTSYTLTTTYSNSVDLGVGGDQAADTAFDQVYAKTNPANDGNPLNTLMIGTNDAAFYGLSAPKEAIFSQAIDAMIVWLTVPSTSKVMGQAGTFTGTTTASSLFGGAVAQQSSTNGSTFTYSIVTNGGPIYEGYVLTDSNGGTATWTIDGVSQGTLNAFGGAAILTNNGGTSSLAIARATGIAAGAHTVVVTVSSATSGSNLWTQVFVGTPPPPNAAPISGTPPNLYIAGVIRQYTDVEAALTVLYDGLVQAEVATYQGDGLNVVFVPVRNYVNATTDMATNASGPCQGGIPNFHPNNCGMSHLRDAFEAAIQSHSVAPTAASLNGIACLLSGCTVSGTLISSGGFVSSGATEITGTIISPMTLDLSQFQPNTIISASSAVTSNANIELCNTTTGGKCWFWYTTGSANTPVLPAAGWTGFYDGTDGVVPFGMSNTQVESFVPFTAPSYFGPATAPTGSCTGQNGAWVFSQDGHATFCASGTWSTKI